MSRNGRTSLMSITAAAMLSSIAGSGQIFNSRAGGTVTIDLSKVLDKIDVEAGGYRDKADELVAKVTGEDRDFTKDEEVELKAHQEKIVSLRRRGNMIREQLKIHGEDNEPGESRTKKPIATKPGAVDDAEDRDGVEPEITAEQRADRKAYRRAYRMYLRVGVGEMPQEERQILMRKHQTSFEGRDLSGLTGGAGGFVCPPENLQAIDVAMKDYSGVLQSRVKVIPTTTGNDLPFPTVSDVNNTGKQVEESEALTTATNPSFGMTTLKAYLFSTDLILVPLALLQDAAIDVESTLNDMIAERLGRITNQRWTTGTGANQPQGIVTAAALGVTAAGTSAITYDETIDLEHSVDPAYRAQAEYMFHDNCLKLLRKLKDSDGRPIWMPSAAAGMANGAPGLLNNRPYHINQNMDSPATGKKSMIFGDCSKYKIRKVKAITLVRLTERYAEKMQIGFFGFMRCDGRSVDASGAALKYLVHP